jgi:UDP-glucose 4-epimerase
MAVLVTGGAGFLGSYVIREFLDAGYEVFSFDYSEPSETVQEDLKDRVTFEKGDIRDRDLVRSLVHKTGNDPIVHLAGILTTGCDRDPDLAVAVNVNGARDLFDAAQKAGNRRVVMASTISVYGRGLQQPIDETMPAEPDGWYGLTKLVAEQIGLLYVRRFGLDFRAVRLAAVTGPGRSAGSGSASLFTSFIPERAALGEPYQIEVTEETAYPVVYIKDAANALFTLATAPEAPRRIYNIASGRVVAGQLVAAVKERIPDARFTFKPDPMVMAVVKGFIDWRINCSRAKEDLGWTPAYTVEQMVDDIIAAARAR